MTQLTRADMAGMTPEQISAAFDKGQFAALTGAPDAQVALLDRASDPAAILTYADVSALARMNRSDLIDRAHVEGRITNIEETK